MARKFFAVVVGIAAGSVFNMALIMVSVAIYAPDGLDFEDPDAMRAYVLGLPVTALLIVLAAHGGGSFVGGAVCALVARQKWIMGALIPARRYSEPAACARCPDVVRSDRRGPLPPLSHPGLRNGSGLVGPAR